MKRKTLNLRCSNTDCFGYSEKYNTCCVLDNAAWDHGKCQFYKSKEDRIRGHLEACERLKAIGRQDLIEKYHREGDQRRIIQCVMGD